MTVEQYDTIKIVARMKLFGSIDVVNVFHSELQSATTIANWEAVEDAAEFMDVAYDRLDEYMTDNLTFEDIAVYLRPGNLHLGTTTWPTLTAGGIATDEILPTAVSALVKFTTSVLKGQGRKYIAGLVESQVTASLFSDANLITGLTLFAAENLGTWGSLLGNTWINGIYRESTSKFYPYLTGIVNLIPAYQRRRKQGVGQ